MRSKNFSVTVLDYLKFECKYNSKQFELFEKEKID